MWRKGRPIFGQLFVRPFVKKVKAPPIGEQNDLLCFSVHQCLSNTSKWWPKLGSVVASAVTIAVFGATVGACGQDTLGVATTVVAVTPTNFATIPPVQSTLPGTTTSLPSNAIGSEQLYTVASGDSPLGVANKYGIALETLLAYNGWVSPAQFPYPGTQIRIPPSAIEPAVSGDTSGGTTGGSTDTPSAPGCGTRPAGTYTVQSGDSVFTIRRKFCVSLAGLLSANNWASSSVVIMPGDVINIPASGS
jgi:LysM repeat protein